MFFSHNLEALVVGHKPGKGNCTGMLGALECELPNGKRFDVGSGFNMDQRRKPPKKGSVITFKFQELSNSGIPRFPVFLRARNDMTWNDVLESAKTKTPISVKQKVVPSTKLSKQHSILFSVIPSRDEKTGKKILTSDDVGEQASSSTTAADTRDICKYGNKCYRKSAEHLKQYQHPSSKSKAKTTKGKTKLSCFFKKIISVNLATNSSDDEPTSPTTTDNLLVKDKNKGHQFDDEDDDQKSETRAKTNKRKRNPSPKSTTKPTAKRTKKS